jgi:hypothetical protein
MVVAFLMHYPRIHLERLRKTTEVPVRTVSVPAEIRTLEPQTCKYKTQARFLTIRLHIWFILQPP